MKFIWRMAAVVGILTAVLAGILAGCHRTPPVLLHVALWLPDEELEALTKQVEEFQREHPSVRVEIMRLRNGEEARQNLSSGAATGVLPDICMLSARDLVWWANSQTLADLTPFHPDTHAFHPDLLTAFSRGGKLLAIPCGWSTSLLYYNREIFQKQGVPFPRGFWHWTDLLTAAQALTLVNEDGKVFQHGLELDPEMGSWAPFVWQNRGEMIRSDGSWCLTDPQFLQSNLRAIDFYAGLVREHRVAALDRDASHHLFLEQKCAMTLGPRSLGRELALQSRFEWDVAPLPRGECFADLLDAWGYALSSQSPHPTEAFELIQFLTRETALATMMQRGYVAPPLTNLFASRLFLDFPGIHPANNQAWIDSLPISRVPAFASNMQKVGEIMSGEMLALMSATNVSARSALEHMEARLEELTLLSAPSKSSP